MPLLLMKRSDVGVALIFLNWAKIWAALFFPSFLGRWIFYRHPFFLLYHACRFLKSKKLGIIKLYYGPSKNDVSSREEGGGHKIGKMADVVYGWPLKYVLYSVMIVYMLCNISRFLRQQLHLRPVKGWHWKHLFWLEIKYFTIEMWHMKKIYVP